MADITRAIESSSVEQGRESTALPAGGDPTHEQDGESALPHPIVGIGASEGGVEACIELFNRLAPDTGMAFVVIPDRTAVSNGHFLELLSRNTPMPVAEMVAGNRPQPDHIYVLPPGIRAGLKRGVFCVEAGSEVPACPIGHFFRSLAASQGAPAIGVVLSGGEIDGAQGLRAIKGEGGIAIVQSPDSAGPSENCRSIISLDYVDRILPPEQIAIELEQIGRQFQQSMLRALEEGGRWPGEEMASSRILNLLRGVSGIDFRLYKAATVRRRIGRRMLLWRIPSLAEYAAFLQESPDELGALQEDLLIGVTRFFRDLPVFAALRETILPHIFANREAGLQVRIWVAGCSSGEEVYSIAICLLEYLADQALDAPIQIFGTDASGRSIEKARSGIYPESMAEEISSERLQRFFLKTPGGYQISKQVRDWCVFAQHNLLHDPPLSKMDLVACRNVLANLAVEPQKKILRTFHYALRPEGFLLLGMPETTHAAPGIFHPFDRTHKFFSKTGDASSRALKAAAPRLFLSSNGSGPAPTSISATSEDKKLRRAADRIILARYGPPGVVIDAKMRILQSRGHTAPFIEMPQGPVSLKITRMLRDSIAAPVSQAVQRAVEQDLPVRVEGLRVPESDGIREITLEVLPIPVAVPRSRCFLVLFVPSDRSTPELSPEAGESGERLDKDESAERLRQDLRSTRFYLQTLIEERDARNQELVLANEEIQSANNAMHNAYEELKNIKEELRSANEGLQAVNGLRQRNAALTQSVNDLTNLLNSVNLPVLMLNSELNIGHFSTLTQRVMNLRQQDIGRPFTDIRLNLRTGNLESIFQEVLETLSPREMEVQDSEGRWYLLRVRPYRTADNRIEGVVVVLVDIDQHRRTRQELRDGLDFALALIESVPLPLAVIDADFRIRVVNEAFRTLAGLGKDAADGRSLPDLALALWGLEEPLRTHLENLRASMAVGGHFDFEFRTPGAQPRVLNIRGCVLNSDLLVTIQDITAHKEVERTLTLERERLADEVTSTAGELKRTQDELRALAGSLFTSQEEERRRVARELHDDIGQKLALLEIEAQQVEPRIDSDPGRALAELQHVRAGIGRLSEEVRRISHALHPSVIEDLGITPAIRSLVEDFRDREQMIVTFRSQNVPEGIPVEIATGLYRITQEALRNVAKHAGKTHVKVLLDSKPGGIRLQVIDSGKGFDPHARRSGLGLISTEERTRIMRGTLTIESEPGIGTRVTVDVPLN